MDRIKSPRVMRRIRVKRRDVGIAHTVRQASHDPPCLAAQKIHRWIAGALLWAVVAPWAAALAAERVALVIGNGAYEHAPRLGNASNDAKDIRDALVKLGFKVEQTLLDKPKEELIRGLKEFRTAAEAAQIAVVFYAGHGIEVAGVNYLVPVDAELRSDGHVEYEAVSLELVTNAAAAARSFGLVVLDACRDNPFARKMRRAGATRSIGRGLGRVEPAGGGMMVAYAAKAGTTADDGEGRNSPYTAALLRHLQDGDLVSEILNKVSQSVRGATGGAQVPVAYGQLPPKAYFTEPEAVPRKPTDRPADFVREWWLQIKDTAQPNQLEAFIEANPEDRNARLARVRLKELWATAPAGTVIRDFLGSGGRGPEMVVIPAGPFRMGCLSYDDACFSNEKPVHDVTIPAPFAPSTHEVTFDEWDACVADGGCGGYRPSDRGWGRGGRPVIHVNWKDARSYASWLSRQTGETYRLPSEAEWEYAARAETATKYSWGNEIGANRANCDNDHCGDQWKYTAPVGSFSPNGFGLYDMHGNVWEWVEDCWNAGYAGAPSDGGARRSGDCAKRVLRGNGWGANPRSLRATYRFGFTTGNRVNDVGFRVARTLTP